MKKRAGPKLPEILRGKTPEVLLWKDIMSGNDEILEGIVNNTARAENGFHTLMKQKLADANVRALSEARVTRVEELIRYELEELFKKHDYRRARAPERRQFFADKMIESFARIQKILSRFLDQRLSDEDLLELEQKEAEAAEVSDDNTSTASEPQETLPD